VTVDDDAAVHFLVGDRQPMAVDANFGQLVRRAVESFGKCARDVGFDQPAILGRGRDRAMVGDLGQDLVQQRLRGGLHLDQRRTWIVARLANRNMFDAERATATGNDIEYFGKDQAVDDMPTDLDILDQRVCQRRFVSCVRLHDGVCRAAGS
jgi:hypothetical protein